MTFGSAELLLGAALLAGVAVPVAGQGTVRAWGLETVATAADPAEFVAGLTASVRPSPRARVALFAGGGTTGSGDPIGRAELVGHFLLQPHSLGAGLYAGGGLAGVFGSGASNGYIVLLVGVESKPGGPHGWFVEAGVGGGARLAAGYRWRKLPPGWQATR